MRAKKHSITLVADKVLAKLSDWVDAQQAEGISPQSLKQVTATLKDIKDLQQEAQAEKMDAIELTFSGEEGWLS